MKVAIYARVSTEDQTTENQIRELEEWIKRRGWEIVTIYRENETAWKAGHQKEWARLKADARMRNFDAVVVWALDRVTRQGVSYLFQQIQSLHQYDVKLISMQETWTEIPVTLSKYILRWLLLLPVTKVGAVAKERRPEWNAPSLKVFMLADQRERKTVNQGNG